jgi:membrane protease YdiL (CAAX protease family)
MLSLSFTTLRLIALFLTYYLLVILLSILVLPFKSYLNNVNHTIVMKCVEFLSLIFLGKIVFGKTYKVVSLSKINFTPIKFFLNGFILIILNLVLLFIFADPIFKLRDFNFFSFGLTSTLLFISAINEEILFRRIFIDFSLKEQGFIFAIFIPSLMFSSVHLLNGNFNLVSFLNILFGGFILTIIYIKSGIWASIFFHFAWNITQTVFGSNVSGSSFETIFDIKFDFNLWTGNSIGFESSLINLLLLIIYFGYVVLKNKEYLKNKIKSN